jgi:hypothetical protein
MKSFTLLALIQGIYFLITGLWPLIHLRSFLAVTGPKVEVWLVKTVGILITVIALVLLTGAIRQSVNIEMIVLALGISSGLFGIDTIYAAQKRISSVYLVDALLEGILIFLWVRELVKLG